MKIPTTGYILISSGPGKLNKMCNLLKNVSLYLGPYLWSLKDDPNNLKTRKMCEKAVKETHGHWIMSLMILRSGRRMKKELRKAHGH